MIDLRRALLAAVAFSLLAGPAAAQDPTPNSWLPTASGTYTWNTPANWSSGVVPDNTTFSNYTVFTGAAGNQTVNVNIPVNLLWIDIGSPNATYFLNASGSGNGLTFYYNQSAQDPRFPTITMPSGARNVSMYNFGLMGTTFVNQNSTAGTLTFAGYNGNPIGGGFNYGFVVGGVGNTVMDIGSNLGAITKNDAGRLLMNAANGPPTGTGAVTVNGGTMELVISRSFPSNGGAGYFASGRAFTVNSGAALLLNGNWLTGDGYANSYTLNGGRIGGTGQFNYINTLTLTGARVDLPAIRAGYFGTSGSNTPTWTTSASGTTSEITSQVDLVNGSGSTGNTNALRINVADGAALTDLLISGQIRNQDGQASGVGAGTFTKLGPGRLVLSNANSYTGGTSIQAGTLLVTNTTGSGTGTGLVSITSSGILGGTGRVAGFVYSNGSGGTPNGAISPGVDGVGTLTVDNDVTLFEDTRILIDVSGPTADKLSLSGTNATHRLQMGARVVLVLNGTFDPDTTYTIVEYALRSGTFSSVTGLPSSHQLLYGPTSIQLVPVPVPEPMTILPIATAGLGLGWFLRRRVVS